MGLKGRLYDVGLASAIKIAGWSMRHIRTTTRCVPLARAALKRSKVFPLLDHYYEPMFDMSGLRRDMDARELPGINFQVEDQLALLSHFRESELFRMQQETNSAVGFSMHNGFFEVGDADVWFHVIRHLKPKKIIEIGSGHSTKVARLALQSLCADIAGYRCEHICIEPYEAPWLDKLGVEVVRQKLEDIGLGAFETLGHNDILFIDSSHVIRPQGDVLREYLQILPRLRQGVVVHIHDIFSPRDYPMEWLEMPRFWNEQYLLEAFLSHNASWQVVLSLNMLRHDHFSALQAVCPHLTPEAEPGSFYIRRI